MQVYGFHFLTLARKLSWRIYCNHDISFGGYIEENVKMVLEMQKAGSRFIYLDVYKKYLIYRI